MNIPLSADLILNELAAKFMGIAKNIDPIIKIAPK